MKLCLSDRRCWINNSYNKNSLVALMVQIKKIVLWINCVGRSTVKLSKKKKKQCNVNSKFNEIYVSFKIDDLLVSKCKKAITFHGFSGL